MIWIIVLMVAVFATNNIYCYIMMIALTGIILAISEVPVSYTLRGIKPLLIILIITFIVNIFTYPGTKVLLNIGVLKVTLEGVVQSIIIAITTTPIALTDGLESLFKPLKKLKVPVHEMSMMMSIALRFIPTLMEETDRIIKAQASRGADFDTGNLLERAKSFIPVLIPLFVSAFKRAEDLATAMESRCYRGGVGRTRMKQLAYTGVDAKISLFMSAFLIVFVLTAFVI
jgi:energy-coupling factor transport system permease protein